jgi:hypothetical protein
MSRLPRQRILKARSGATAARAQEGTRSTIGPAD